MSSARVKDFNEFFWANVITSDPAADQTFFSKVLHWSFKGMPHEGHFIMVGDHMVGSLFDVKNSRHVEAKPQVLCVIKAQDAEALVTKVNQAGGHADPAMKFYQGIMVECKDPNGARFQGWQSLGPPSTQGLDGNTHGAVNWYETLTDDVDRAKKFYGDLFGWTFNQHEGPFEYTTFNLGEHGVGGMMAIEKTGKPHLKPHWNVYVTVTNVDDSLKVVEEAGGKIVIPAKDIPGTCRFAGVISPGGVMFYIATWALRT